MLRSLLFVPSALVFCASCGTATRLSPARIASTESTTTSEREHPLVRPTACPTPRPPDAPQPFIPPNTLPCVPLSSCRVVARHRVPSAFARRHGISANACGLVTTRERHLLALARDTFVIEVTPSCEVPRDYYIASGEQIWLPFVSADAHTWSPMEVAAPERFRPLGGGFYTDGISVYDRSEELADQAPPADPSSFRVCALPSDEARSRVFYPDAVDSHSGFGRGEHGDLERARQR